MKKQSVVIKEGKRNIIKMVFVPGNENKSTMRISRRTASQGKEAA